MAESENQLELKKRARRRLVGSIALALTAAIVLPMLMDHEPKPLTQDIQIRIPSQDAANHTRPAASRPAAPESDTGKSKPSADPAPAPEVPKPIAKTAEPEPSKPETGKPEPAKTEAAKPPTQAAVRAEAKPQSSIETKPEPKVEPKAEPKDALKAEREAKVAAILSGSEPAPGAGQFILQLGAFGDPANAAKVGARVKAAGFNAYTEVLKGPKGNQTRVRAGPFASREAAEQAAAKLKQAGLAGAVVPK